MGDSLVCQLWECDGGVGGCDPAQPAALPSAAAGDDLLGQATLQLSVYQVRTVALGNALLAVDASTLSGVVQPNSCAVRLSGPRF
jgi:hypothetical protein